MIVCQKAPLIWLVSALCVSQDDLALVVSWWFLKSQTAFDHVWSNLLEVSRSCLWTDMYIWSDTWNKNATKSTKTQQQVLIQQQVLVSFWFVLLGTFPWIWMHFQHRKPRTFAGLAGLLADACCLVSARSFGGGWTCHHLPLQWWLCHLGNSILLSEKKRNVGLTWSWGLFSYLNTWYMHNIDTTYIFSPYR